jgi:CheY-like chemotaxis protein
MENMRSGTKGEKTAAGILVVDDQPEIRRLIGDYLRDIEHYAVADAGSGFEALGLLARRPFDLIISDINMPGMRGFELLDIVKGRFPSMKRVLITAYNVEDYFDLAIKYDVGNIFVKTVPFNFEELSIAIRNLLSNDIFGLDHYFEAAAERVCFTVRDARSLDRHARKIADFLGDRGRARHLEMCVLELLTNAVFYGAHQEPPERKDQWKLDCKLPHDKAIIVTAVRDREKYGLSVCDDGGRLEKSDVLFWMNRQARRDENGLPIGVGDEHGRGLFIARRYFDRLIINVQGGKRTEVILINYNSRKYSGFKPLYINEI